jgi:hypothetical protein
MEEEMDVFGMFDSLRETAFEWATALYNDEVRELDWHGFCVDNYGPYYEVRDFGSTEWWDECPHFIGALIEMQFQALYSQRRMKLLEPFISGDDPMVEEWEESRSAEQRAIDVDLCVA